MLELPRIGAELAGYRLESLVSRGGMAVVYLAEDLRLGRKVALKILALELAEDDSFRERFLRESRVAASIDHPNVIPIYDAGEAEGLLYIAMRHVEDTDLRGLLRLEAPLEVERSISIATQVAGALGAAHRRDLVHRDVKPANILMILRRTPDSPDHVYLSDFGLAKHAGSVSGLTKTGQFMGTVSYTAPEQVEGRPVDGRTDIYALGCVLFECLTARPPFKKEEDLAVVMAHLNEEAPPATDLRSDCPAALADVIATTLAKRSADRFEDCDALIDALRGVGGRPDRRDLAIVRGETRVSDAEPASAGPAGAEPAPAPPGDGAAQPPSGDREAAADAPRRRLGAAAPLLAGLVVVAAFIVAAVLLTGGDGDEGGSGGAATVASSSSGGPAWRELAAAPTARQQAAGAVVDGEIWIVGGLGGEEAAGATTSVEVYDPATDTWSGGPDLPLPLHHAVARSYRGELVVIGGWVPDGADLTAEASARVFALRDGAWTRLPDLRHARAAAGAAIADGKIVVVGGQADDELVTQTEVFDGRRWTEGAPMPTPREHLAAASDGRFVYALGGRELSSDTNLAVLERYDPATDTWAELPSMPIPAGSFDATVGAGHLVAVGGEAPTEVIEAVQSFDLKTQRWSTLPSLRSPRHGLTAVVIDGSLYAIDGAAAPTHAESTTSAEVLDLATAYAAPPRVGEWRALTGAPSARQQVASAVLDGRIWLLGGLIGESAATAATEAYDPAIDTWIAGPDLPLPLHHATAVTYDDELVVIGGWVPDGADLTAETSDRVFALRGGEWVELPALNRPRAAAAASVVGDRIVVVGGQDEDGLVAPSEVFDGEQWTDAAEIPTPREHLAAASDGRYLYAVGGRELSADKNLDTVERYDPTGDEWAELPPLPVPSGSLGAAIVNGQLVAVGGEEPTTVLDAVQAFDLEAGRWASLPPLPTPRHGLAVVAVGEILYALDGALAPTHAESTNAAEALDFE